MSRKQLAMAHGAIVLSLVYTVGCGQGPARIQAPGINASSAGRQAMQEYDANGDGVVSGDELDSAPSLKAALSTLDTNSDGGVSADEVTARVKAWQAEGTGLTTTRCIVTRNGKPLPGAKVVFEPEAFLGGGCQPRAAKPSNGCRRHIRCKGRPPQPGHATGAALRAVQSTHFDAIWRRRVRFPPSTTPRQFSANRSRPTTRRLRKEDRLRT